MAEEIGKASGIEKFDGTYFGFWKMQIVDYLSGKKLHLPLLGEKLATMKHDEWTLFEAEDHTISRSIAHNVVK